MANGLARYTNHYWAEVPVDSWGVPSRQPHGLNDGRGSGYTPHQAFVTEAFVVAGENSHPIERDVCRIVAFDATHVTLVVGPDAPSTILRDVLAKKLIPTSMLIGICTRYVPGYELGRGAIADETMERPLKVGLPVSLVEAGEKQ